MCGSQFTLDVGTIQFAVTICMQPWQLHANVDAHSGSTYTVGEGEHWNLGVVLLNRPNGWSFAVLQALRDVRDAAVRESEALHMAETEREVAEEAVVQLAEAQREATEALMEAAESRAKLASTAHQLEVHQAHTI